MNDFSAEFNRLINDIYHNVLLTEETKRKHSNATFTFRDRNAISFLTKHRDGINLSDMADYLKISRPSTTALVKKLEKNGLVQRIPDPSSARGTLVKITRKGRHFAAFQSRFRKRLTARVSDEMSEEEKKILLTSFSKLNEFFEDSIKESVALHETNESK